MLLTLQEMNSLSDRTKDGKEEISVFDTMSVLAAPTVTPFGNVQNSVQPRPFGSAWPSKKAKFGNYCIVTRF